MWDIRQSSMLKNEIKAIRMFHSEHLVRLKATYESKYELIILMEYLQGTSLY